MNTDDATRAALKIAGLYCVFALAWIYGSDHILDLLIHDHKTYIHLQTFKGFLFVGLTTLLLLFLVHRSTSDWVKARNAASDAADNLRLSEARFRGIYERALAAILIVSWDGRIERCNPAACKLLGYEEGELVGLPFEVLIHPDDRQTDVAKASRLRAGELPSFETESRYLNKNGSAVWVHKVVSTLPDGGGEMFKVFALAIDLTASRRATQALRESEQRLSYVMAATKEGIWDWSICTGHVAHNARWCQMLGLDDAFLSHPFQTFVDLIHADDLARVKAAIDDCIAGRAPYRSIHKMRRTDGSYICVEDRGDVVERDADGGAIRMVGSMSDITSRQTAQKEADRQRILFQSVFESSPDCIIITNPQLEIVNINPAFTDVFGYSIGDLRGLSTRALYASEEDWLASRREIVAGRHVLPVRQGVRKNGDVFPCQATGAAMRDAAGNIIGFIGSIRDMSVERKREQALREKQRLEALGRLTGGIAHDFNNLLTVVSGYLQLLELDITDEKLKKPLDAAMRAAEMGARINRRLMTFARQRNLTPVRVDLNVFVDTMLDLLHSVLGESVTIETRLSGTAMPVSVDVSELENAVLNLALNARDAMPIGGRFVIETSAVEIVTGDPDGTLQLAPGSYVRMSISDTGEGMSDEVRARAFEPFFTTKEPGKGSGMGLTSLHGFVRQSGGSVTLYSEPEQGTTVDIYLPRAAAEDLTPAPALAAPERPAGHGETVLLVEDNPEVRDATAQRLGRLGYRVLEADSAVAACSLMDAGAEFDLVFTDIVMPGGMSGFELVRRVAARRPDAAILTASGFPDAIAKRDAEELKDVVILRKPYSLDELARAIAGALRRSQQSQPALAAR